jgi:nucleoside-diphosphate-sugar epimerase
VLLSQHNEVVALDIVPEKIEMINRRQSPIEDKVLQDYFNNKPLNLRATIDSNEAFEGAEYVIIATPTDYDSDMSPWLFTSAINDGRSIDVYNYCKMKRDFTYIDDKAQGTVCVLDKVAESNKDFDTNNPDPSSSNTPFRIYNIGNNQPIELLTFI